MLRWKATVVMEPGLTSQRKAAPAARDQRLRLGATTARGRQRRAMFKGSYDTRAAPVLESVTLSPGGHRKHVLTRTSPGGTTRSSEYTSPLKGDPYMGDPSNGVLDDDDAEQERYGERLHALEALPCDQSDAQRSALARAKRKASPQLSQRESKRQPPLAAWDFHLQAYTLSAGERADHMCAVASRAWE